MKNNRLTTEAKEAFMYYISIFLVILHSIVSKNKQIKLSFKQK